MIYGTLVDQRHSPSSDRHEAVRADGGAHGMMNAAAFPPTVAMDVPDRRPGEAALDAGAERAHPPLCSGAIHARSVVPLF
ncbi:hypothetical protein ACIO1C_00285 [Streptomyces sp. NPDC087420]|uniref:hypothetical protein n=1 Tax=Streptomyces sp. NPDC087420 TaxID=3365785 RepID=UPI003833E46E